jgi:hypothetical protein
VNDLYHQKRLSKRQEEESRKEEEKKKLKEGRGRE